MSPALSSSAAMLFLQEHGHAAEKFLGIPLPIWQLVNLVLFLAVLAYFVAKPMAAAFGKRQQEIEKRAAEAVRHRADVDRLTHEIEERTVRLEREIEEVRRQGVSEGQAAREALLARAEEEAERVRRESLEEIERRVAAAQLTLRQTAADLTAGAALELVSRELTDDDRKRLVLESASRVKEPA